MNHHWHYVEKTLLGESEIGPILEPEFKQLLFDGKLNDKSKVCSATRTKGQWVFAGSVAALKAVIDLGTSERERQKEEAEREKADERAKLAQEAERKKNEKEAKRKRQSEQQTQTNSRPRPRRYRPATALPIAGMVIGWAMISMGGLVILTCCVLWLLAAVAAQSQGGEAAANMTMLAGMVIYAPPIVASIFACAAGVMVLIISDINSKLEAVCQLLEAKRN